MALLDVFIVNVAAPEIQRDLGMSSGAVQWVIAGYVIPYAVMLITGGRIGDAIGRRRAFTLGMGLFALASAACGAAPNAGVLIAARALQGLAAALMTPQVLAIIQVEFPVEHRARCMAWFGAVVGAGSVAGQLIGGGLIALDVLGLDWRTVFLINIPIGIAAIAFSGVVPESRAADARRIDRAGVALSAVTLLLVVFPIVEGREAGWPWWVPVALVASVVSGWVWLRHEQAATRAGGAPLVDLRLFSERGFSAGLGVVLAMFLAGPCLFLVLAFYLQEGHGLTALESAAMFTPLAVTFVLGSFAAPRLVARFGDRALGFAAAGAGTGAAVIATVVLAAPDRLPTVPLLVALALFGFPQGIVMPTSVGAALKTVGPRFAGSASGVVTSTQQVGNVIGIAVAGVVFFAVRGDDPTSADYAHAFALSTAWTVGFALVAATLALRLAARARAVPAAAPA